jgi:Skp family chaperone for outer membrane proteins
MRFISAIGAVAVIAAAFAITPDASAQRGGRQAASAVIVVNYGRILAESAMGRDMAAKLGQVRQQLATEAQSMQPEAQSIEQERNSLAQATRNMTADQVRANSSLSSRVEAFNTRMQQFQARQQGLQGDLQCSELIAAREFGNALQPIVRSVMQSRGASVVIDSGNAQTFDPTVDATDTVLQQFDAASRTSNASRHAVSECAGQQQQ